MQIKKENAKKTNVYNKNANKKAHTNKKAKRNYKRKTEVNRKREGPEFSQAATFSIFDTCGCNGPQRRRAVN